MDGKLKRVLVYVPEGFLKVFDRATEDLYASRNEAIRAGMMLIIEALRSRRREDC